MIKIAFIALALFCGVSCKSVPRENSVKSFKTSRSSLLVLAGGYNSCRTDIERLKKVTSKKSGEKTAPVNHPKGHAIFIRAQKFLSALPQGTEVLATCYDSMDSDFIYYSRGADSNSDDTEYLRRGNDSSDAKHHCRNSSEREDCFYNRFSQIAKNKDVTIIGHSYGGWTAMKLAVIAQQVGRLHFLATIDPISLPHCGKISVVSGFIGTGVSEDCTRAPILQKDGFSEEDLQQLAASQVWYHYWQEELSTLHSGKIALPGVKNGIIWNKEDQLFEDSNAPLSYPATKRDAHRDIAVDDERVYDSIVKLISIK